MIIIAFLLDSCLSIIWFIFSFFVVVWRCLVFAVRLAGTFFRHPAASFAEREKLLRGEKS
jgi:hypothetical protein